VKNIFANLPGCDGSHCGLSDLYPDRERRLKAALKRHKPFDTGWWASKKEIASGRLSSEDGKTILAEASVSDDFDTEGKGSCETETWTFDACERALGEAWHAADEAKKDNEPYQGFKVLHNTRSYGMYVNGKPQGKATIRPAWVETLILPKGDGFDMETPPGDNYHKWGWQYENGRRHRMPLRVRQALLAWANAYRNGKKTFTVAGWTIKPWG
jgi:hypothetical protein